LPRPADAIVVMKIWAYVTIVVVHTMMCNETGDDGRPFEPHNPVLILSHSRGVKGAVIAARSRQPTTGGAR
jgi:hypothetical protein